ncbi:MAG: FumA C-terminus/TtdB family hydratase beta subunit [Promethearchaeia archaeon]
MIYKLKIPVNDDDLIKLKIGDIVYLTGIIITARDQAHKRIIEYIEQKKSLPKEFSHLKGSAIYHCGPIVRKSEKGLEIISGGPTTSQRMDKLENEVVKVLGVKFIIGKGGMKNLKTSENKIVYLSFTGGCGAIVNKKINRVLNVVWEDLGQCEAVYFLDMKEFGPLIVAQDIHGNSLYKTHL